MIEAITDYDRINRYYVWNGKTGEQLYSASEGDIGCCARNCFQGQREFEMPFLNKEGNGFMKSMSADYAVMFV